MFFSCTMYNAMYIYCLIAEKLNYGVLSQVS